MYSDSKADTSSQPGCAGEVARGIPCVSVAEAVEVPAETCPATAYDASYVADGTAVVPPSPAQPTYTGSEAVIHFLWRVCFVAHLVLAAMLVIGLWIPVFCVDCAPNWKSPDARPLCGFALFTAVFCCFVALVIRAGLPDGGLTPPQRDANRRRCFRSRIWILAPLLLCVTFVFGGVSSLIIFAIGAKDTVWLNILVGALAVGTWMVTIVSFLGYITLNLAKDCRGAR